jgi:predicted CoA-binding protein
MSATPAAVEEFLKAQRIAVTGVARDGRLPANAIYRRLKACGYDVVPVNPRASEVEGTACYPDLRSVPGEIEAVMVASPPASGPGIARQALERGVRRVWFHRSFGEGSVSQDALRACRDGGVEPVVGGCPLMFCGKVDVFHRCMAWWLQRRGRVPR